MLKIYFFLLLIFILLSTVSYSQPGTIDLTFGENGYVRNIPGAGKSIQVNNNQEIFIRGNSSLIKLNPEGEIDLSFGNNGIVEYNLYNLESSSTDMLIQDDGKIVLIGNLVDGPTTYIYVLRSNTNGFIDTTFGNNGVFLYNSGNEDKSQIIVQTEGDAFLIGCQTVGPTNSQDFMILKLDANGNLDPTFGNNGVIISDMFGRADHLQKMAVDSSSNIFATGQVGIINPNDGLPYIHIGLIKYFSNGSIDTSFGDNGKSSYNLANWEANFHDTNINITTDDNIYISGRGMVTDGGDYQAYWIAKLTNNGNYDTNYGSNGRTAIFGNTIVLPAEPITQIDNKLVASAFEINFQGTPTFKSFMKRVDTDGGLDLDFGLNGRLELESNFYPRRELVFQSQYKLITLGGNPDGSGTVLVRINIDDNILKINEEPLIEHTITLLPNPSSDVIFINSSQNKDIKYDLEIYTISGIKLKSFNNIHLNNYRLNVSTFTSGVYFVKIKSDTKTITSKKFIIK